MSNKYGILPEVEQKIRSRDKMCVYCRKKMIKGHPRLGPTIEHLNNIPHVYDPKDLNESDLAICCHSCNTSRGNRDYWVWFDMEYCKKHKINKTRIARVVRNYIKKYPTKRKFN